MSSTTSHQQSSTSSAPRPKKIKLRITPSVTSRPTRPSAPDKQRQDCSSSSSGTSPLSSAPMGTSPLSPLPDETTFSAVHAGGEYQDQGNFREPWPGLLPGGRRNIPSTGEPSRQISGFKRSRGMDEDKENRDLVQPLNPHPNRIYSDHPPSNSDPDPTPRPSKHVRPGRPTALEKELYRLSSFTFANPALSTSVSGRTGHDQTEPVNGGKELRAKEKSLDRRRSGRGDVGGSGVGSGRRQRAGKVGRERTRTVTGGRERDLPRVRTNSDRTSDDHAAPRLSSNEVPQKDVYHLPDRNHARETDPRSSLGLEDVEAALTIQYLARDAELGRSRHAQHQVVEMPDDGGEERSFGAGGDDAMEVDKLRGSWGLGRGECSNCRVDEVSPISCI